MTDVLGITGEARAITYSFTIIEAPGFESTRATEINNTGQIVGHVIANTGPLGYRKDGDSFTFFTVGESPSGINDTGHIVGAFADAAGHTVF